jgi:hypothetical protein
MRDATGRAVLDATFLTGQAAPTLSGLVGRVVAARAVGAVPEPAAPAPYPAVLSQPGGPRRSRAAWAKPARCSLVAAHGGAGVSALLRAGLAEAGAVDAGRVWPDTGLVLLVTRTSTSGLEHAQALVCQHAAVGVEQARAPLLGLVLVADAPGRLPARTAELADLLCGAVSHSWQVPWLTEWRLASREEPLPVHPEVSRLCKDLRALIGARITSEGDLR